MKETQWKKVIEEYEGVRGTISQKVFCEERSLVLWRFKYYLSIMRKKASQETSGGKFIEARIEPVVAVSEDLRLRVREGMELIIPSGFDDGCLKKVLKVLL